MLIISEKLFGKPTAIVANKHVYPQRPWDNYGLCNINLIFIHITCKSFSLRYLCVHVADKYRMCAIE